MAPKSALLGIAAGSAISAVSFSALAGPMVKACPTTATPLSTYLSGRANATCTVLDKTISAMSLSGVSPESDMTVTPVLVTNNPGLKFNLGFESTLNLSISYTITAPPSGPMTDASLAMTGSIFCSSRSAGVTESLSNSTSLSASTFNLNPAPITFAATTSLNVTDAVSTGSPNLAGSVDTIENQFSETPVSAPEPSSLALLGIGLPALGLARRRRKHS